MVKKIFNVIIFVGLAVIVMWALSRIKGTVEPLEDTQFILQDAAITLKINSLDNIVEELSNSSSWNELSKIEPFMNFEKQVLKMDSIFESSRSFSDNYNNIKLYLSMHVIGKNEPDYLYRFLFPKSVNERFIFQQVNKVYINRDITSRKYEGQEIFDISDNDGNSVSYTYFKNQLLISSSAIILENILRQTNNTENTNNRAALTRLLNTAGKTVSANIIINHKELAKYFKVLVRSGNSYPFNFFRRFSDWSVLDLNFNDNTILANGFTNASDSLINYLSVFSGQEPSGVFFTNTVPANTKLFISLNISNTELFINNYKHYLKTNSIGLNNIDDYREILQTKYKIELSEFYDLIDKEISYIHTDFKLNDYNENIFALVKVKSPTAAKSFFKEIIKKYANVNGKNANSYFRLYRVDNSTKFEIFNLPLTDFLLNSFGQLFHEINTPYLAMLDDYVVFANSKDALEKFIHLKILGKTLQNDFAFSKMSYYYSSNSNIHYYQNIPNSLDIISTATNDDIVSKIRDNIDVFNKIPVIGLQYNNTSDFTFSSFFINYFNEIETDAHTLWETLLDTSIQFKPSLVKNHYTNENEIFVQDLKNNIYLINRIGRVLWKIRLNEQIVGEAHQVDYYKNGKLQLLFSTKSQLHLIDRNGNYVERYPVNLRSEASAPIALFDYDNNKNYRLFIPTIDKSVYAYNLEGKIIAGWAPNKAERIVKDQLKHYRVANKDYIVFSDGLKTYILNRRGEVRVPNNIIFQKSENNNFVFEDKTRIKDARFAVTDTSGQVWFFYFDGSHETKNFRKLTSRHFFDFQDINADGYSDYIFLDKNELYVYDQRTEKEVFSYKFKNPIPYRPVYFHFSFSDRKLGITDVTENKVYLINSNGNLYQGFPLQGNSLYSIGRLTTSNRFNLIVGNSNNFLLNYSVQ